MRSSRFFWKNDEDGKIVHRLQDEWDGNKGPSRAWGRWHSQGDNWEIHSGTAWSRWGVGIDYDWNHESAWTDGADHHYRRQSLMLTFGPWYVGWMRCKPVQWHERGCYIRAGATCDCDLIQQNRVEATS